MQAVIDGLPRVTTGPLLAAERMNLVGIHIQRYLFAGHWIFVIDKHDLVFRVSGIAMTILRNCFSLTSFNISYLESWYRRRYFGRALSALSPSIPGPEAACAA
jgi:hypothetical protein